MKTINYTGSSKIINRIVQLLNRKAPLPLDGDGDAEWGTNGQVLTTDGNGNTSWTTPQGGGGGDVTDVEVNGTSVVNAQGVAEVTVPTNTSDLNNDSGFIDSTDLSTALADYTPTASLASVATSGQYSDLSGTPSLATVATSGDYDDLTNKPTIPAAQVQSDWTQADNTKVDYIKNKPTLATVATSGSYNDLSNKPTIPAAQVNSDWNAVSGVAEILNKPSLAAVATSGSYSDLSGTPDLTNVAYKNVNNQFTADQTINRNNGTTSAIGSSYSILGNNIPSGTAKNSRGVLRLFGSGDKYAQIYDNGALTANRNINLPDKSGTIALTSDIPTVPKIVFYGTCTGQAANQTKAVDVDASQSFALTAGIILLVKFDANNTYSATADNPIKLKVNTTAAKNIYYAASNAPTGTNTTAFGRTNYVNQYYYDGTNWVWTGSSADNNTTYSNMSANELTTGTATTARSISAKVLKDWNTAANTTYSNTTSGLSATKVQGAIDEIVALFGTGAGSANSRCYREEITSITADMWSSITNGTFSKVHVGMHYTAPSGRTYWFADADYFFSKGDPEQTFHHMLVIEDEINHTAAHHTTSTTTGGAASSDIYTNTLPTYQNELEADFGAAHIKAQRIYLSNATSGGIATGGAWVSKGAAILNMTQVFGHSLGGHEGSGQCWNAITRERQLSLFRAMPETIVARTAGTTTRLNYWCDDVIDTFDFGVVLDNGSAFYAAAIIDYGIRRAFLIG